MELFGNGIKELVNLMGKDLIFKSSLYDEEAGTVVESFHTLPCPKVTDENGKVKTYFDNDEG